MNRKPGNLYKLNKKGVCITGVFWSGKINSFLFDIIVINKSSLLKRHKIEMH